MAIKWSWAFGTETPTVLEENERDFQSLLQEQYQRHKPILMSEVQLGEAWRWMTPSQ